MELLFTYHNQKNNMQSMFSHFKISLTVAFSKIKNKVTQIFAKLLFPYHFTSSWKKKGGCILTFFWKNWLSPWFNAKWLSRIFLGYLKRFDSLSMLFQYISGNYEVKVLMLYVPWPLSPTSTSNETLANNASFLE